MRYGILAITGYIIRAFVATSAIILVNEKIQPEPIGPRWIFKRPNPIKRIGRSGKVAGAKINKQ